MKLNYISFVSARVLARSAAIIAATAVVILGTGRRNRDTQKSRIEWLTSNRARDQGNDCMIRMRRRVANAARAAVDRLRAKYLTINAQQELTPS